jgi:hypothetical protein
MRSFNFCSQKVYGKITGFFLWMGQSDNMFLLSSVYSSSYLFLTLQSPEEKYLSLGPNIYGLVKTLFATYTYYTTDNKVPEQN